MVTLEWTYTQLPDDTLFFNLYRGSDLIAHLYDDVNATITTFEDKGGSPGEEYIYYLDAFRILEGKDSVDLVSLTANAGFPALCHQRRKIHLPPLLHQKRIMTL